MNCNPPSHTTGRFYNMGRTDTYLRSSDQYLEQPDTRYQTKYTSVAALPPHSQRPRQPDHWSNKGNSRICAYYLCMPDCHLSKADTHRRRERTHNYHSSRRVDIRPSTCW